MEKISKTTNLHSLLGASSSHRWLNCTPSAVIESGYPDSGSEFAREGSLAHALCAVSLKELFGIPSDKEEGELKEYSDIEITAEMTEYVEGYVNFVRECYKKAEREAREKGKLCPEIRIEQHLDYSSWVPEGFGTGDALIVGNDRIEIIDFKFGKGVEVSAERNSQMMLYALGALDLYDYAYDIEKVIMTIYQPRISNLSTFEMSVKELSRWAYEEVMPLARLAYAGKGVRNAGEWCRFCKAKGDCQRIATESLSMAELNPDAETISAEDLPKILERLDMVKDWVKAIEERSLARALSGERIPGYKIVEGRSTRKIVDPEGLADSIMKSFGAGEEDIYRPRELKTLTELEKNFGKKFFSGSAFIEKPAGKPTLVADTDKRPAMRPGDEFGNI